MIRSSSYDYVRLRNKLVKSARKLLNSLNRSKYVKVAIK